jgi:hypothetical protein
MIDIVNRQAHLALLLLDLAAVFGGAIGDHRAAAFAPVRDQFLSCPTR